VTKWTQKSRIKEKTGFISYFLQSTCYDIDGGITHDRVT
jgi:hypothetical protein